MPVILNAFLGLAHRQAVIGSRDFMEIPTEIYAKVRKCLLLSAFPPTEEAQGDIGTKKERRPKGGVYQEARGIGGPTGG